MNTAYTGQLCGIYPRVSTVRQAKEDKTSLKDQEQACRDYADEQGMIVDEECVEPEAYTSTQMSRPGLNTLLATMKAHRVGNLIIDSADRLTRQGLFAAATFLEQFTNEGIILHVVSMELIVTDRQGVKAFIDAAYQAEGDNLRRARKAKRAKINRANAGIFIRGPKPPYGYRYTAVKWDEQSNVTERRIEPDERPYVDRGFPTTFAATPYQARREILRLYADEGWSFERISHRLTAELVPTSTALFRRDGTRGVWFPRTVNRIIRHPINHGVLVNHFHHQGQPDQVIEVPALQDAILDSKGVAAVSRRLSANTAGHYPRTSIHSGHALLGGGLGRCGRCGGTLRVKGSYYKGKYYLYYSCSRRDKTPSLCPGMFVSAKEVDWRAWDDVTAKLNTITWEPGVPGSELRALEMLDADRAAVPRSNGPTLEHLRAARDAFLHDAEVYGLEVARAKTQLARDTLQRELDRLEPEIAKANAQIANLERQTSLTAERARVLGDFLAKYRRYFEYLNLLDPSNEGDIPIMAAVLRAVGTVVTVPADLLDAEPEPPLGIELTLTAGSGFPWADNEDLVRMLEERREWRIQQMNAWDEDPSGVSVMKRSLG
jgi:DNA invertase Pin-like site-specific DNA recombinase